VTPYVDQQRKCTDRCRARLAWSVRAEAMTAPAAAALAVEGAGGNGRAAAKTAPAATAAAA
jgi:hypothetical protein